MTSDQRRLALILGSGFEGLVNRAGVRRLPQTAAEAPTLFEQGGVLLLLRHGPDHRLPPHRIDHRAHLTALARAGATDVVAFGSVGALTPSLSVGALLTPDDLFDATFAPPTLFDDEVRHTPLAEPFHVGLSAWVRRRWEALGGGRCHPSGTYVGVRGPRYPTRAELRWLAERGEVVGMTIHGEATIAAELALRYACLTLVTDGHDEVAPDHAAIVAAAPEVRSILIRLADDLRARFEDDAPAT
jgi:5'-methylthioadenosine phosphorylase